MSAATCTTHHDACACRQAFAGRWEAVHRAFCAALETSWDGGRYAFHIPTTSQIRGVLLVARECGGLPEEERLHRAEWSLGLREDEPC